MSLRARPLTYGDIDVTGSNQYPDSDLPESIQGFPDGAIPPAKKFNTLGRRWSGWCGYLDQHVLRSDSFLDATAESRLSPGEFAYATGPGLTQSAVESSMYAIDGYIVDLSVERLQGEGTYTRTFAASKWTHFYVDNSGTMTLGVVAIGDAAAPPAGTHHIGTMETDATSCVAWIAGDLAFNFHRIITDRPWRFTCSTGEDPVTSTVGAANANAYLAVVGAGTGTGFRATMVGALATAKGGYVVADVATAGIGWRIEHHGSGDGMVIDHDGSGVGLSILHAGSNAALDVVHNGTAASVASFAANAGNIRGGTFTGSGTAMGLLARSGNAANANGIVAMLMNDDGFGFACVTPGSATDQCRAAYFEGAGEAIGAEIRATSNYALLLQGDVTSPSFAPLRFITSDVRPSVAFGGEVAFAEDQLLVSSALDGAYRGVWTSPGGKVSGMTASANGAQNTAQTTGSLIWVTAATVTASAGNAVKLAGRQIVLRFQCEARNVTAGSANTLSVRFFDVTANALVAGSQRSGTGSTATAGFYMPDTTTNWSRSIVYDFRLTVNSTGDRTWRAEIQATTGVEIAVRDCSLTIDGSY